MDFKNRQSNTFKKIVVPSGLFIASGILLSTIHPPLGWSFLAWVALVPFILACSPTVKPTTLVLTAYIVSVCYWLFNLHWVAHVTILGWIAFCLYTAILWPIVALCLRYCRIKKIPIFLAAAVLFVAAEHLQGFPLGGFSWRFLAHSQYRNTTLIQISDIFGQAGLSFLIAMVNGLVAELIIAAGQKKLLTVRTYIKTALVILCVFSTIAYGRWRINQSPAYSDSGPMVAALQSNVPQAVKRTFKAGKEMFDELMQQSKAGAAAGAQLIVWPETMVQAFLDSELWPLLSYSTVPESQELDQALKEHAKGTAYLLVGSYGTELRYDNDANLVFLHYNSAFLYRPDGRQDPNRYDKIHLVLFGEYLPFRNSCRWIYMFLRGLTPYNFDYSLDAGDKYTVFEMTTPIADSSMNEPNTVDRQQIKTNVQNFRFGVIICYEDTVPGIARRFAVDRQGRKQIDWLVNISNDGWFVKFKDKDNDKEVVPSAELAQHAAICSFRAVENRLPILRSTNTGISCLIDSLGRIRNRNMASNPGFPADAMKRTGIAGWFTDKMPIDKRVTFFSRHGQWLDNCCTLCLVFILITPLAAKVTRAVKVKKLVREDK
jgi:apolipoprotein N-acyltransferase